MLICGYKETGVDEMDVYDYLDSNGYTNPNPYPVHPTKPPEPGGKSTASDYRAYASLLEKYYLFSFIS